MATPFFVEIVALSGSVYHGETTSVRAPGTDGGFEILANHAPMLASLGIGVLSLKTPDGQKITYATSGGFLQVLKNRVIILAESAEAVGEIDVERAKLAEKHAAEKLSEADKASREEAKKEFERARNRLRLSMGQV